VSSLSLSEWSFSADIHKNVASSCFKASNSLASSYFPAVTNKYQEPLYIPTIINKLIDVKLVTNSNTPPLESSRDIHSFTSNKYANEIPLLLVPEIPINSPINRPNLLPISTNSGDLTVAQLLETLRSPLSSPIEKVWASQLVSLGIGIDTGIVD